MTRSGSDYLARLRDGRSVFIDGERVQDVTAHPAFAAAARTVADLYDIAHDPANRELMTFPSPVDGRPINRAFQIPRTRDDLVARRHAIKRWADATYGLFGRSPDHVASLLAAYAGAADYFSKAGPQYARNVAAFYERAAHEDLYLAYAIVHPTVDRAKPAHQQPEPNLYASVVDERDDGIVVRGAQMLATGGVFTDFIYVSVILPLRPGDEDYALSFVAPTSAPGLKLYARRPYASNATSVFDYPLSSRFDETDSLVVFDDVLVPWEHVFIVRDRDLTFGQFVDTPAHVLANTQAQIRFWSKLQFLVGLVNRAMMVSGQTAKPETLQQLGDLATRASLVEGLVLAAESTASLDRWGIMRPNPAMLYANQVLQSSLYPEVVQMAREMLSGSLLQLPSSVGELITPETRADMDRYIRWPGADAEARIKLLKLAWDMVGSEFASRHVQYEMLYAGQASVVKLKEHSVYDWAAADQLVSQCLESYDLTSPATASNSASAGRRMNTHQREAARAGT